MKRNYGIDLLRLVLMYMVVLLHVLGAGGVLRAAEPLSGQYAGAYLLEALAFCAVNGYGMITGYVSYGKKWRLAGLGQLWLQVLVYALGISACVWLFRPEYFSLGQLVTYTFPAYRAVYWYFSSYVGLFFLIPVLNRILESVTGKQARKAMFVAIVMIGIIPTGLGMDPFNLQWGYSTAWLACLYLIGGSIRKFDWGKTISPKKGQPSICYAAL